MLTSDPKVGRHVQFCRVKKWGSGPSDSGQEAQGSGLIFKRFRVEGVRRTGYSYAEMKA